MTKRKYSGKWWAPLAKRYKGTHGNFCGPYWSDGKVQPSIGLGQNTTAPIDLQDAICQVHDVDYYHKRDPKKADSQFMGRSISINNLNSQIHGLAVGLQGLLRANRNPNPNPNQAPPTPQLGTRGAPVLQQAPEEISFPVIDMKKYARNKRRVSKAKPKRKSRYRRKSNKSVKRYKRRTRSAPFHNKRNFVRYEKEFGDSKFDLEAVYCGHGTSGKMIQQVLFMTMIKQLFAEHGTYFTDFEEKAITLNNANGGCAVRLRYQNNIRQVTPVTATVIISATTTYRALADSLSALFDTQWQGTAPTGAPVFLTLELFAYIGQPGEQLLLAKVDLNHTMVNFGFNSSIRIQNKTLTDTESTLVDTNNVNPLEASVYYNRPNRNYFQMPYKYLTTEPNYVPWCAKGAYGHFTDDAENHLAAGSTLFKQPPAARNCGAKYRKKFVLHPGQVVVDKIAYKRKVSMQTLLRKLFEPLRSTLVSDDASAMEFGIARAYGFEKLAYDRSVLPGVSPCKIGYELNVSYNCSLKSWIPPVNPRYEDNTTLPPPALVESPIEA